jgi:FKBP12-rapamycin complex-associated protein
VTSSNQQNVIRDYNEDMMLLNQSTSEEYYPTMAMNSLVKILRDPSLSLHHSAVIQSVMNMFKTLGVRCVMFLPKVVIL